MRVALFLSALALNLVNTAAAQDLSFQEMRWRDIGPTRAGRARAAAGVASQPNVFYAGFDNGGVWRSTDYGANWVPLFDAPPNVTARRWRRKPQPSRRSSPASRSAPTAK